MDEISPLGMPPFAALVHSRSRGFGVCGSTGETVKISAGRTTQRTGHVQARLVPYTMGMAFTHCLNGKHSDRGSRQDASISVTSLTRTWKGRWCLAVMLPQIQQEFDNELNMVLAQDIISLNTYLIRVRDMTLAYC